jgi:histidine triad (HIT) family protein
MNDCLFCKLAHDPQAVIWQNEQFSAFKDIHPKARIHILIVPKKHIENLDKLESFDAPGLIEAIQTVAKNQGVSGRYRIQINVGRHGGQEIDHLHVHLMAD